jgi:hypothetical protein
MKKYKVAVFGPNKGFHPWWHNFLETCSELGSLDDDLEPYNAKDIPTSDYVEFDSEEDFLAFKLRFI